MSEPFTVRELAIIAEASKEGAKNALERVGLQDERAVHDIRDLREFLDVLRGAKRTVGDMVLRAIITFLLGALSVGIYYKWK